MSFWGAFKDELTKHAAYNGPNNFVKRTRPPSGNIEATFRCLEETGAEKMLKSRKRRTITPKAYIEPRARIYGTKGKDKSKAKPKPKAKSKEKK